LSQRSREQVNAPGANLLGFGVAALGLMIEANSSGTEASVKSCPPDDRRLGTRSPKRSRLSLERRSILPCSGTHASGVLVLSLTEHAEASYRIYHSTDELIKTEATDSSVRRPSFETPTCPSDCLIAESRSFAASVDSPSAMRT
jgi:hypothetical protein